MPTRHDKLAADIEAAEKKIFRNPGEAEAQAPAPGAEDENSEGQDESSTPSEGEEDVVIGDETDNDDDESNAAKDAQQPHKDDWEERFKTFKSMADATIHGLRQENLHLKEDVQSLKGQMQELVGKINAAQDNKLDITNLFSDEERNLIGEETIKGIEKAVTSAIDANVSPLKSELEKERQERNEAEARQVKNERANADAQFINKLREIVPNLDKLDKDPKFIQWMAGPDIASGAPRERLFKIAQGAGDVHRVAEFFLEYTKLMAPKKDEKMEKKITPSNQATAPKAPKDNKKGIKLSMKQIEGFYDDVARGRYRHRPKEQQKMEQLIDRALRNSGKFAKR
jgi:hypothetical protein